MKIGSRCVTILAVFFLLVSCQKGEEAPLSETVSPEKAPEADPVQEFKGGSLAVLKTRNLAEIESYHCGSVTNDQLASQAAFGCLMVKTLRLIDSEGGASAARLFLWPLASLIDSGETVAGSFASLLHDLGEPAPDIHYDLFDTSNPEALFTKIAAHPELEPQDIYKASPKLPFHDFPKETYVALANTSLPEYLGHIDPGAQADNFYTKALAYESLRRMKQSGISFAKIQQDFLEVLPPLEQARNLLKSSMADPSFTFVIPKEFYSGKKDIQISRLDLDGFYAGALSFILFIKLLDAYEIGLNPADFSTDVPVTLSSGATVQAGTTDQPKFVNDCNGVGGDGKRFALLKAGMADQSALIPLLSEAVNSFIAMYDSIKSGSAMSEVFQSAVTGNIAAFEERNLAPVRTVMGYLRASLDHPGELYAVDPSRPNLKLNVTGLLGNLPDPGSVSGVDPCVKTVKDQAIFVTEFFKTLLSNRVTY